MAEDYKRFPIQLDKNNVMVVHIFHRHDCFEDMWMLDCEHYQVDQFNNYKESAKQFILQLEDRYTPAFLMALRDEINKVLSEG